MNRYSKLTDNEIECLTKQYTIYTLPNLNPALWEEALKRLDKRLLPIIKKNRKKIK